MMLRIDIAAGAGGFNYRIPPGNPFAANPPCGANGSGTMNCPEIFAWGFRNPWRWSFDRQTGELWVGDVGQSAREEVDRVALGGNYDWRCFEGTRNTGLACGSPSNLQAPNLEHPEYHRADAQSDRRFRCWSQHVVLWRNLPGLKHPAQCAALIAPYRAEQTGAG